MLSTPQDLFSTVATFAIAVITVFLCWALYEIAWLIHQANRMVEETRDKLSRFERALVHIGEKLASSAQYLGFIAEGGKQLLSVLRDRQVKKKKSGKHDEGLSDMSEDAS